MQAFFSDAIDIENLFVKKIKKGVFDNPQVQKTKNGKVSITEQNWEMLCHLFNVEKIDFFEKKPTDYHFYYFWIIPVQDWFKTSPANVVCLLGTLNYSSVPDTGVLLVKNSKIDAAFLIINE